MMSAKQFATKSFTAVVKWLLLLAGLCSLCLPSMVALGQVSEHDRWFGTSEEDPWFGRSRSSNIADVQEALTWTRHYEGKVGGNSGPRTRAAIRAWLTAQAYPADDILTDEQTFELMSDALRRRNAFGWALFVDDTVGFSVGVPTGLVKSQSPTRSSFGWSYRFEGTVTYDIDSLGGDGCTILSQAYDGLTKDKTRLVGHNRGDDWFGVSMNQHGQFSYVRAQCRSQGIVVAGIKFPSAQLETFRFLFALMHNSLSLKPTLNLRTTPSVRYEMPTIASNLTGGLSGDRKGSASALKFAFYNTSELQASQLFRRVSPAVYVVKGSKSLGSAVAIGDRELLTNCHVIGDAASVTLQRDGQLLRASISSADRDADRCVLSTTETLPKWVSAKPYGDIKIGERAYTIGAPQGLELTIAEGIVSSKRRDGSDRLLQTSAPISPGSSGGGLFDAYGNLIGITTFVLKGGQNLNFAIAAEDYAK